MKIDTNSESIENLFVDNSATHSWYVTRTKSRCEKKLNEALLNSNIHSYLPLFSKENSNNGLVVKRELPLFSGYMFVYVDYESRMYVEDNRLVASLYIVNHTQLFLEELKNIELTLRNANAITPITGLLVGQKVRVCRGPLAGVVGEIIKFKKGYKLILKATFIGQGIETEVNADSIELID
ncbi:MAG: hypothetical protein COA79_24070 [Planctomycetota bacterium]|nr:MAG: hypothetical protein COA79_24070 [Planctomycetota bacterium]